MLTTTEENYLKGIYKLSEKLEPTEFVHTNAIASTLDIKAASVSDMIKRLAEKKLLDYTPYKGVRISEQGHQVATNLLRKHRLWEVFLVEKLDFTWAEVHPIAEQLEHIQSTELTDRLDTFLNYPKFDPHGDPIPDKEGKFRYKYETILADLSIQQEGVVVGVKNHSPEFLSFLDSKKLGLGAKILVKEKIEFDGSMLLLLNQEQEITISQKVSNNLYIQMNEALKHIKYAL